MYPKIIYRKELLQAIDAFLEGKPSSLVQAHQIIQNCYNSIQSDDSRFTLNDIVWSSFIVEMTDSVFYENEKFLRETREILLGHSYRTITRTVFSSDYRTYFTKDEEELYAQLLSMLDFIMQVPFKKIYDATHHAWQNKVTWAAIRKNIPEATLAERIDEEYLQKKALIESIFARRFFPEDVGDEKIYHLVLQEITSILTEIRVGQAAIAFGYPIVDGPYIDYRNPMPSILEDLDAKESLSWAKKSLEAIVGEGNLFISWRLSKALTFDGDMLLISLH